MDGLNYGNMVLVVNIFSIGWLALTITIWRALDRQWNAKPREQRGRMGKLAHLALTALFILLVVPAVALVMLSAPILPLLPLVFWPTILAYGLYRLSIKHHRAGKSDQDSGYGAQTRRW